MKILKSTETRCGNKIELIGDNIGDENILVIGVFHGDEPQGKFLIENYLKSNDIFCRNGKNVLFIPCLNPDGMEKNIRTNSNGVDLNRNFPTKNWVLSEKNDYYGGCEPKSEIETNFVCDVIEELKPCLILTLHAPYKVVNYDGPAENIAVKISETIGYPVEASIGYPTPGSFGTYCGIERNIPTITLELDETCPVEDLYEPVSRIFDKLNLF